MTIELTTIYLECTRVLIAIGQGENNMRDYESKHVSITLFISILLCPNCISIKQCKLCARSPSLGKSVVQLLGD